jgi:hypothetical protein
MTHTTETRLGKNGLFLNNGNEYKPLLVAQSKQPAQPMIQRDLWPLVLKRCQQLTGQQELTIKEITDCFNQRTGAEVTHYFFLRMENSNNGVKHTVADDLANFLSIPYQSIKKPSNQTFKTKKPPPPQGQIFQSVMLFWGIKRNHNGVGCYK